MTRTFHVTRRLAPLVLALGALAAGCASNEPAPTRWLDADALAGGVTLRGDVYTPGWVVGRTWVEVRGPEFRVEVFADGDGVWRLPAWPADASPVRVVARAGEYPRSRAEGRSVLVELPAGATQVTVPTIRLRDRVRASGSFAAGVAW